MCVVAIEVQQRPAGMTCKRYVPNDERTVVLLVPPNKTTSFATGKEITLPPTLNFARYIHGQWVQFDNQGRPRSVRISDRAIWFELPA